MYSNFQCFDFLYMVSWTCQCSTVVVNMSVSTNYWSEQYNTCIKHYPLEFSWHFWTSPTGWYQGERIRDQERGWFPGSFTVEISSTHVRARNLRQRYRLLAISGSLLDELKKEKERYEKEEKRKDRRRTITMKDVISSQAQATTVDPASTRNLTPRS